MNIVANDNGGRWLGGKRRQFSYLAHIPKRRSGKNRRRGFHRRIVVNWSFQLIPDVLNASRQGYPVLPFLFWDNDFYFISQTLISYNCPSKSISPHMLSRISTIENVQSFANKRNSPSQNLVFSYIPFCILLDAVQLSVCNLNKTR